MFKDPIIEEVHWIRDKWAASFEYDLRALCEEVKRQEKRDFLTDEHGNFIKDEKGGLILKSKVLRERTSEALRDVGGTFDYCSNCSGDSILICLVSA